MGVRSWELGIAYNIVEMRQCDHKNKHTLTRLIFLSKACDSLLVARRVRDCSGILCERFWDNGVRKREMGLWTRLGSGGKLSEQRYSGKPDA